MPADAEHLGASGHNTILLTGIGTIPLLRQILPVYLLPYFKRVQHFLSPVVIHSEGDGELLLSGLRVLVLQDEKSSEDGCWGWLPSENVPAVTRLDT